MGSCCVSCQAAHERQLDHYLNHFTPLGRITCAVMAMCGQVIQHIFAPCCSGGKCCDGFSLMMMMLLANFLPGLGMMWNITFWMQCVLTPAGKGDYTAKGSYVV